MLSVIFDLELYIRDMVLSALGNTLSTYEPLVSAA